MTRKGSDPFASEPLEKGSGPFLSTPLQFLKGVGPRRAADLEHAGLSTVEDRSEEHTSELQSRGHLVCRLLLEKKKKKKTKIKKKKKKKIIKKIKEKTVDVSI